MSNISNFVKRLRDIMRNDPGINGDAQRIEQIAWLLFLKVYDAKDSEWKAANKAYTSIIPDEIQWRNWAHEEKNGSGLTGDDLLNFVNNTVFPRLKSLNVSKDTEIRKAIVFTTFSDANQYMKDGVLLRQVVNVIDEIDFSDYEECHAFGEIYESILKELQSAGSSGEFYTPRAVTDFMARMIKPQIGERMADFACGTGGFITSWLKELAESVSTADDQKQYAESVFGIEKKQFPYMLCVTNLLLHDVDNPKVFHDNSLQYDVLNYTDDDRFDVILMNPPYGGSEKADIKNHFPDDLASSETADLFMSVIMYRLKAGGRTAVIIPDGFLFGNDNAKTNIKRRLLTEFNLHTIVRLPGSVFSPYTSITTNILFFNNERPSGQTWFYRVDIPADRKHFSKTKPMELKHFADCIAWWDNRTEITDADGNPKAKCFTAKELEERGYNLDLCGYPHEEEEILSLAETIQNYEEKRTALNQNIDRLLSDISTLHDNFRNGLTGTNGDKLSISDDKSQIDTKLRQLNASIGEQAKKALLQEAVQGRLVPQMASDGNAADLLKQIQAEKAQLIKEGKLKKEKPLPPITDDEIPFDIPENWCWCRLGEIIDTNIGLTYSPSDVVQSKGTAVLRSNNILNGKMNYDDLVYVSMDIPEKCLAKTGDLLICARNGSRSLVGKCALIEKDGMAFGAFMALVRSKFTPFIMYFINSPVYRSKLEGVSTTTINQITQNNLRETLFPLPPLTEQKRIVSALEQLLPLCEKLGK